MYQLDYSKKINLYMDHDCNIGDGVLLVGSADEAGDVNINKYAVIIASPAFFQHQELKKRFYFGMSIG